jgi:hypothetical protein
VQLADSLAVGLRPVVQGVAAVPVLFQRASQVDEDPDRGVPWLHARIVTVSQHVHPGERALGEERQQALAQRVRYCVVHGSNLTAGSDKRASAAVTCFAPGSGPGETTITFQYFAIPAVSNEAGTAHDGTTTLPTTPTEKFVFGRKVGRR